MMTNRSAEHLPGAGFGRRSETPAAIDFEPSKAQFKYLYALEEALERRQSTSNAALCRTLKMSRQTLWEWRLHPGFRPWLHDRLQQTSDDHWPLILLRCELLAIQGSVRSAEFIAKVRFMERQVTGLDEKQANDGDPTTNYTVHLLLPRPPALPDAHET